MYDPGFRKQFLACIFLALAVTSSAVALAQGPGGFGGPGGRRGGRQMSIAALPIATLDTIVKLTPDQKARVTKIHDTFMQQSAPLRPKPGQGFSPAVMQQFQQMQTLSQQADKDIEAILKPAQKTKLAEARKVMGLYRLAGIPMEMYGQIKLTADQKTRLEAIQQGMRNARGGGDREGMRAAMQTARQNAQAVLTPAQQAQIARYVQAHPEAQMRRGGFGGGFGGGGGRRRP